MKILVCDDDPVVAQRVAECLARHAVKAGLSVQVDRAVTADEIASLDLTAYDIAFLDVDLGSMTGLELAARMRSAGAETVIIFVTNYIEYAPEGYKVQAFRYLLKSALEQELPGALESAVDQITGKREMLSFTVESETIDLPLKNVLFIESEQRHLILHTVHDDHPVFRFYGNMTQVAEQMEPAGFLRVQKSYLVNMEYIESFQYGRLRLQGGLEIPSSKKNYSQMKERYIAWRGRRRWHIG